jgi:ADP-ribose pyrophosphatase
MSDSLLETPIFSVEKVPFVKKDKTYSHYRLLSKDWVNVLPITCDNKAVLIRQYRSGSGSDTLELPGGIVEDSEKKDLTMTAYRELEEETGYRSNKILSLGSSFANPAIQNNKIHFFLALACAFCPKESRQHFPDESEDIKVELYKTSELEDLVRYGRIQNSLGCLGIMLSLKYLNK